MINWLLSPKVQALTTVAALILTVVALIFAAWVYISQKSASSLSLQLTSNTRLVSSSSPVTDKLDIFFDGESIDELWLLSFRLMNDGDVPITPTDFIEPLKITQSAGRILEVRHGETVPVNLRFSFLMESNHETVLERMLLNPGNSIVFSLISTGSANTVGVTSRIVGTDDVRLASGIVSTESSDPLNLVDTGLGMAVLGGIILGLVVFNKYYKRRRRERRIERFRFVVEGYFEPEGPIQTQEAFQKLLDEYGGSVAEQLLITESKSVKDS